MKDAIPFRVHPMLATLVRKAFDKKGWVYEEKYDGFRILAYKEGDRVSLMSRNDIDLVARFPQIAAAVKALKSHTLLLDGEAIVVDRKGVSHFQLLQQDNEKAIYAVFDCLFRDGKDLRREPLSARRVVMDEAIGSGKILIPSHRLAANGLEAYKVAQNKGYEGVVAKDLSSPYVESRSSSWLKVKVHQEDEFVIGGFTAPAGSRKHFGALLLGVYSGGKLHFVGKVGTGFDEDTLSALYKKLHPLVRSKPAFVDPPRAKGVTFIEPKLVAQISYQEITEDNKLRQPVYLGLRDDKKSREVSLPEAQS
ncbi:MAG: non-homologous end-joining DNA ligase [Candidatus Acidiferrales bacterium]